MRAGYGIFSSPAFNHRIALFAAVKAPLADEETGFSTGEWDFGGGIAWLHQAARTRIRVEATYWRLGQPPDVSLEDPFTYQLQVGRFLTDGRTLIEASAFGRTETVAGDGGSHLIGLSAEHAVRPRTFLRASLSAGLSDTAPDVALVLGMRFGL